MVNFLILIFSLLFHPPASLFQPLLSSPLQSMLAANLTKLYMLSISLLVSVTNLAQPLLISPSLFSPSHCQFLSLLGQLCFFGLLQWAYFGGLWWLQVDFDGCKLILVVVFTTNTDVQVEYGLWLQWPVVDFGQWLVAMGCGGGFLFIYLFLYRLQAFLRLF